MTKKETVTATQAAKMLNVSRETIYSYCETGRLKNVSRFTGEFLFNRADVETFIKPKRGRRPGTSKTDVKHPRLQQYYQRRKGASHGGN